MALDRDRLKRTLAWAILQYLIWTLVCSSAAMAWAADDPGGSRPAENSAGQAAASDGQVNRPPGNDTPETDADWFFRVYMLPGTAVLVLIVATTLTAVFYPKSGTE